MKRFLTFLAAGALALGFATSAHAQFPYRTFGAGTFQMDDNSGHTLVLSTPQPGTPEYTAWGLTAPPFSPFSYSIPVPPPAVGGHPVQSGFLFAGPFTFNNYGITGPSGPGTLMTGTSPNLTGFTLPVWIYPGYADPSGANAGTGNYGGSAGAWGYSTTTQLGILTVLSGVAYNAVGQQATATPGTDYLYNVAYTATPGTSTNGALINSTTSGVNVAAAGLSVTAAAGTPGTGTVTALSLSATGGSSAATTKDISATNWSVTDAGAISSNGNATLALNAGTTNTFGNGGGATLNTIGGNATAATTATNNLGVTTVSATANTANNIGTGTGTSTNIIGNANTGTSVGITSIPALANGWSVTGAGIATFNSTANGVTSLSITNGAPTPGLTTNTGESISINGPGGGGSNVGVKFTVSNPGAGSAYDIQGSGVAPGTWNVTAAGAISSNSNATIATNATTINTFGNGGGTTTNTIGGNGTNATTTTNNLGVNTSAGGVSATVTNNIGLGSLTALNTGVVNNNIGQNTVNGTVVTTTIGGGALTGSTVAITSAPIGATGWSVTGQGVATFGNSAGVGAGLTSNNTFIGAAGNIVLGSVITSTGAGLGAGETNVGLRVTSTGGVNNTGIEFGAVGALGQNDLVGTGDTWLVTNAGAATFNGNVATGGNFNFTGIAGTQQNLQFANTATAGAATLGVTGQGSTAASTTGGSIAITGGSAAGVTSNGGNVTVLGGTGTGTTGAVNIQNSGTGATVIGNATAGTNVSVTGGTNWSVTNAGVATFNDAAAVTPALSANNTFVNAGVTNAQGALITSTGAGAGVGTNTALTLTASGNAGANVALNITAGSVVGAGANHFGQVFAIAGDGVHTDFAIANSQVAATSVIIVTTQQAFTAGPVLDGNYYIPQVTSEGAGTFTVHLSAIPMGTETVNVNYIVIN